jgi:hypothetical protein
MTEQALMEQICQLGQMHLEGNIVPPSWYQHLKYPSGKPYHIAITLLSEIVYWFRPRMVRDEHTGEFQGWAKKFKGDGIQRGYAAWGAPFGFTKREAADAIKYLVAEGYITTDIRDVTLPDGTLRPNVVVVTSVSPDRLRLITYNSRRSGGTTVERDTPTTGYDISTEGVIPHKVLPPAGSSVSTSGVLPQKVTSSPLPMWEGDTAGRNCLESILESTLETNNENSVLPESKGTANASAPSREVLLHKRDEGITTTPAATTPSVTVTATKPIAAGEYPTLLIQPKSRHAVLHQGQRATREDLSYPNVASAYAWAARTWKLALVTEGTETPALAGALETLDSALSHLRERALRAKQLTFTQVLDDYLRDDEGLCAVLRAADAVTRLVEFTAAIWDILTQWDDAPSADDLAALRSLLGDNAAA